jgi:hypothetical protein
VANPERDSAKRWLALNPEFEGMDGMRFRLTYAGRLEGNGSPKHKHEIRKALHPQLKRLWEVEPNLISWGTYPSGEFTEDACVPTWKYAADEFKRGAFRFVPLAMKKLSLLVGVEILFLRPDVPGGIIKSGDIDNRLKTLFDALRMPSGESEFGGYDPAANEDPFFVLLEDDGLISHASVETDTLLEPTPSANNKFLTNDARLVITVSLKPYKQAFFNAHFG